jgi:hypothetical protein
MRQIVDDVFEIRIGYAHAHLIVVDDGVVLHGPAVTGRAVDLFREQSRA